MEMDDICLSMLVKTLIKYKMLFSLLFLRFQQIPFMTILFTSFSFTNSTNLVSATGSDTMALAHILRN